MKTYREILLEFKGEFHRGDRVEGKYIDGSPYTGSVVDRRFHTKNSNLLIYTVKLDVPITKAKRDSIMITWDIKKDMPKNDATMKPSKSKLSTAKANAQINREIATLEDQLKQVPRLFGKTDRAKREADDIKKEIKELKKKLK